MSQGIVKITPRSPGQLVVTVADENDHGVTLGEVLEFDDPKFPVSIWDIVECDFTSPTECRVTRILVAADVSVPAE